MIYRRRMGPHANPFETHNTMRIDRYRGRYPEHLSVSDNCDIRPRASTGGRYVKKILKKINITRTI